MNANTLYEIFEATRKHEHPDLITDDNDRPIREFLGRHYDALVDACKDGALTFEDTVAFCEATDKAKAEGCTCDTCEV